MGIVRSPIIIYSLSCLLSLFLLILVASTVVIATLLECTQGKSSTIPNLSAHLVSSVPGSTYSTRRQPNPRRRPRKSWYRTSCLSKMR